MACRGHARAARRARAAARVQVSSLAPETGHPKGCPVSGAAPSAQVDPLRSNARRPLLTGFIRCKVVKRRRIVQDFPYAGCDSWPKSTCCLPREKVTQNIVYAVLLCTMFSAFNSLVIFCRNKICRFYKKFLTFFCPCGIHKSGDGRHPSV